MSITKALGRVALVIALFGAGFGAGTYADLKKDYVQPPTRETQKLKGTVVDEIDYLLRYYIVVKLPDGTKKIFAYTGEEAILMNRLYDAGDTIEWYKGHKPGLE